MLAALVFWGINLCIIFICVYSSTLEYKNDKQKSSLVSIYFFVPTGFYRISLNQWIFENYLIFFFFLSFSLFPGFILRFSGLLYNNEKVSAEEISAKRGQTNYGVIFSIKSGYRYKLI